MIEDYTPTLTVPQSLEARRVPDSRFARAYARTGDRGRAIVKSAIAALYEAREPSRGVRGESTAHHAAGRRTLRTAPRPWFLLALDPQAHSPIQLAAAVVPAVSARAELILAARPAGKGGWPDAQLAALELCGVEHVFSPSTMALRHGIVELAEASGPGLLACLGDRAFCDRLLAGLDDSCDVIRLPAPAKAALHADSAWDREALGFAQPGLELVEYANPGDPEVSGLRAAFAPDAFAPSGAALILEPGREALWDWPQLESGLFFTRTLVYG
ncbi:hypothetical protein NNJEOMEG_02424 [Fundidesulfovibrio magnetotacticus]|uniref:Uncharacterized protein n=1 Tax=Fundidesulfovibrio magnetotacticus TaxID=2730080 RepID=A0A6V8LY52_9BACT|nr:hypothetical protein [Fundidesulfovibrio magnetotacticus]GFK94577.1 hypothetical protein NNJEOMEG_02424 [Fundidesulfovibrio magnetotacticus]